MHCITCEYTVGPCSRSIRPFGYCLWGRWTHGSPQDRKQGLYGPSQKICRPWIRSLGYRTRTPVSCTVIPGYLSSLHQHPLLHAQYRVTVSVQYVQGSHSLLWGTHHMTNAVYNDRPCTNTSSLGETLYLLQLFWTLWLTLIYSFIRIKTIFSLIGHLLLKSVSVFLPAGDSHQLLWHSNGH